MTASSAAPVKHAVILAHPDPDSFNASIAEAYCWAVRDHGHVPVLRDLYALHFDPILRQDERPNREPFQPATDVEAELTAIDGASVFTLVYPIWFGTPPAMLKGYVERVLGAGVTPHEVRDRHWHPLLSGKRLLSFSTSAMSTPWLAGQDQSLALRTVFDDYLAHAFSMARPDHFHFGSISANLPPADVDRHLAKVGEEARHVCMELDFQRRESRPAEQGIA